MHLVIVLAGHSCAGIDEIYFDGELAFDADGVAQGRFAGFASVEKRLGAVPQAAFTGPQVTGEWTADHRLDGCTAIALRLVANSNVFASRIPGVSAIVRGRDTILTQDRNPGLDRQCRAVPGRLHGRHRIRDQGRDRVSAGD